MQLELPIGMVIWSQDAIAEFVSKLRLDESISTKLQAIIKEELHTGVRMRITGIDGDMVMSEIGIVVKLVLKGAATQRGELHEVVSRRTLDDVVTSPIDQMVEKEYLV